MHIIASLSLYLYYIIIYKVFQVQKEKEDKLDIKRIPKDELPGLVKQLSSEMQLAAANLEFEKAAALRDEIEKIKEILG